MKNFHLIRSTVLFFVVSALSLSAFAIDPDPDQPDSDGQQQQTQNQTVDPQQQPGAGRISYISGDVSTQRGDNAGWGGTTVNAPIGTGDEISTGEKGRAEVQLDFANVMRLSESSQAKIADLAPKHIQLQISRGTVDYSTFRRSEADIEIDTPNMAIRSLHPGNYRIQVNSDSETQVIVRHGEAEITTPKGSTTLKEGEMITVRGTDDPEYQTSAAPATDDWDKWNKDRDRQIADANSYKYSNHYYTGAQDLDNNGQWSEVPGYGQVWSPNAGPDWVPYRDGSWVWQPYWGWTWVSYEPWGWAPYHYGRWFYYGARWCWWPGPVVVGYRPLWAPAYVSFYGFGGHIGVGFGAVGWIPIGPFDVYRPWWGGGWGYRGYAGWHGGYIGPLGIAGRHPFYSNVQLAATDVHVRGAISTMPGEHFGAAGFHAQGGVSATMFSSRSTVNGLPATPTNASLRPVGGNVTAGGGMSNTHFFSVNHSQSAAPSFSQQRVAAESSFNHGTNGGVGAQSQAGGWNRFGGASNAGQERPALNLNKPVVNSSSNNHGYGNGNGGYGNNSSIYNRNTYPSNSSTNNSSHSGSYGGNSGRSGSYNSGSHSGSSHSSGGSHGSGGSHSSGGGSHSSGGGHHGK